MTDSNDTMETARIWLRDSHLLNRTGAGAAVAALGLATATPPSDAAFGLAALLALAGSVIRFWAAGIISKNRELATTGPYAYVRNPLYTGSMLIAIAFLILNGNPWFVIPAVIGAVVLYMRTIESEEADLRELFGADFERYRDQVPAIIPWRGRVDTGGNPVTYSLEQSLFNKEFNGVVGTVGMLVLFYLYAHWIGEATFRVGTTLIVIALMAVRGTRRAAKEREIAAAAAERAAETPPAPAAEPEPAPMAEPAFGETPEAAVAEPTEPVIESATESAPESAAELSAPVGSESVEPAGENAPERVAEPDLPEPATHAEITEAELAKLTDDDAPEAAAPAEDADDSQRALLEQIDADEVAEALGALELLDEGDDKPRAGKNR